MYGVSLPGGTRLQREPSILVIEGHLAGTAPGLGGRGKPGGRSSQAVRNQAQSSLNVGRLP